MNLEKLQKIIINGESESLELKKTTGQRTEAAKTICALLNGLGGFVIFGVSDQGKLIGQQVSNKTLEELAAELRRIEPPAFPEIKAIPIEEDKKAIVIRITGEKGIYTYDGRPYLRCGSTTQIMPKVEYERRLLERLHAVNRWENQPVPEGISIKDLDEKEIRNTLTAAIQKGRMDNPPNEDIESILIGFRLIHEGKLLNAALALYGNSDRLHPFYPQFSIRLARFKGKNRLADFLDNRSYWGHAFDVLRRGEMFLRDHMPIAGKVFSDKMVREDYPMYPPRAIREALANSICHRDYSSSSGSLAVAMYDDHLEIINPGTFHFGLTPDKLIHRHASKPWNPIMAEVFYRTGIIEHWGTGTLNILDWCKENQNPSPKWEEQSESIILTLYPSSVFQEESGKSESQLASAHDSAHDIQVSAHDKLLEFCQKPRATKEIMQFLHIKHRGLFYKTYLKPLLDAGLLSQTEPDKPRSKRQKYYTIDKS